MSIVCHDIHTQSCTTDLYDYVLLSPDWTWQNYSVVCGRDNDEKLPLTVNSTSNELSLFFRSSIQISARGINCTYHVTPTTTPSTTKIQSKTFNGPGMSPSPQIGTFPPNVHATSFYVQMFVANLISKINESLAVWQPSQMNFLGLSD